MSRPDPTYHPADEDGDWPPCEQQEAESAALQLVTPPKPKRSTAPRVDLVHFLESLTPAERDQWMELGHIRPLQGQGG